MPDLCTPRLDQFASQHLSRRYVHLEAVTDLTSEAYLAGLRRFVARRGKPVLIWSNHGANFVGAARLLTELHEFLHK